jgi:tripartite-type tricarboxylate transporter receptor subunit TctC
VDRLSAELHKLADSPDVQQRVRNEGGDPISSTAEEYAKDMVIEDAKWGGLVKKLGLKVE